MVDALVTMPAVTGSVNLSSSLFWGGAGSVPPMLNVSTHLVYAFDHLISWQTRKRRLQQWSHSNGPGMADECVQDNAYFAIDQLGNAQRFAAKGGHVIRRQTDLGFAGVVRWIVPTTTLPDDQTG
jgi:hypothetical protein